MRTPAGAPEPELTGVEALSADYAWAVGSYSNGLTLPSPWTSHWDGKMWRFHAVPGGLNVLGAFYGVAGVKGTTLTFAVGSEGYSSLIYAWNGNMWNPSYSATSDFGVFYGVSMVSSSDAWAVGYAAPLTEESAPLAAHWNGSQWTSAALPLPKGYAAGQLNGVAAIGSSNVWAVGWAGRGSQIVSLWEHWDGHHWTAHAEFPAAAGILYAVAAVPRTNTFWAVGQRSDGATLTERLDGRAFTLVSSADPFPDDGFRGVAAFNAVNVWAVGGGGNHRSGLLHPLIEQWDGSAWQFVASLNAGGARLAAVAAIPGTSRVWAVGDKFDPYSTPFSEQCSPRT